MTLAADVDAFYLEHSRCGDLDNLSPEDGSRAVLGEEQACCRAIRSPSRAWPFAKMTHCRSVQHVAALCGVDATALRRAVRSAAVILTEPTVTPEHARPGSTTHGRRSTSGR